VAVIGASGKTGIALVRQALDRGLETVGVCRDASNSSTKGFKSFSSIRSNRSKDDLFGLDRDHLLSGSVVVTLRYKKIIDIDASLWHITFHRS
jgi:putative NADH-flavin reductase